MAMGEMEWPGPPDGDPGLSSVVSDKVVSWLFLEREIEAERIPFCCPQT
jgi:hypothetical protein